MTFAVHARVVVSARNWVAVSTRSWLAVATRSWLAVAILLLVTACSGHPARPASVARGDTIQPGHEVRSGHLRIRVLAGRCGIYAISGTHAFFEPLGQLCRLRITVADGDSSSHEFSLLAQRLVLADGQEVAPSSSAMHVKRQPDSVTLGAEDAAQVVVWWEVPVSARVSGVRLVGDQDPDADGAFVMPSVHREGVVVPLRGVGGNVAGPTLAP